MQGIYVSGEKQFEEKVLDAKKPVVVDFHADWCNPCLKLAPILLRIVESRKGKIDLAKVNIDENQELVNEGRENRHIVCWIIVRR